MEVIKEKVHVLGKGFKAWTVLYHSPTQVFVIVSGGKFWKQII
jgi:hypothetical protein